MLILLFRLFYIIMRASTPERNFSLCMTLYGRSLVLIIMDAHQPAIRQSHPIIRIGYWELPTNQGKKQNDIDTYYAATLCMPRDLLAMVRKNIRLPVSMLEQVMTSLIFRRDAAIPLHASFVLDLPIIAYTHNALFFTSSLQVQNYSVPMNPELDINTNPKMTLLLGLWRHWTRYGKRIWSTTLTICVYGW